MDSSLFLIKEYENLQNEGRRKFPGITKDTKNAITLLKEKGQKKSTTHEKEKVLETLLNPIEKVFESKAQRLYPMALSALGKLCMTPYLTKKGAVMTIKILNGIPTQELKDEMMQINVLQIVMVCLSPNRFTMWLEFVDNTLATLLRLYESKAKSVVSTAKAALNQLFSHVINELIRKATSEEDKEYEMDSEEEVKGSMTSKMSKINKSSTSNDTLRIASKLLKGLVSHLNPSKDSEWPVPVNNSTTALALDLLALIVGEGKHYLADFSELMYILDEVFDPLLDQMTSMKSNFGLSIRLINCITLFALYIECGLEPLTRWCLTFINIKANTWQKLIAFEAFTCIFTSKSLVKSLAESNEQWCLANILKVFEEYLASINESLGDDIFGHRHPYYQQQKLNKYLEDKNFEHQIPPPDTPVLVKLLIECLNSISNQFMKLQDTMKLSEFKQQVFNSQHCNTLLNVLSFCLYLCEDEVNIQTILNTYQNLFSLAGIVENTKMRSTIINSLGKFTLPKFYDKLSAKNILIIKKIINISHCLSKYFDSKCWYYTFKIMQRVEPLVREELGLKPIDEEYSHKLINDNLKRDWSTTESSSINQTMDEVQTKKILKSNAVQKRRLSHDEEDKEPQGINKLARKGGSIQQPRATMNRRKQFSKKDNDLNDWNPLGRSKTIAGHQKTQEENWSEELFSKENYKIDIDQINTSISSLFLTTLQFSDDLVKSMISGLGELIVNNVEELSAPTSASSNRFTEGFATKPKKNLFSLRKLTEIVLVNIYRVEQFWQIIIDQLMVISVWNNEDFRSLALEAFSIIIIETLLKKEPSDASMPKRMKTNMSKGMEKLEQKDEPESSGPPKMNILRPSNSDMPDIDEKVTPTGRKMNKRVRLDSDLVDSESVEEEEIIINLPNEETIDWEDENWQIKVLKPF